ncbi:MAG: response regulator transcription factor [Lachnospiraceae bacterium]|nr:response regulator transcription factor [Lachnospiraceae bacterium]
MGMKILIVDDEETIRCLVRYNLEKAGFSCVECATSMNALEKIRAEKFDLVLLDLMLPDMSGLDFCRIAKRDASISAVPIIMLTAKSAESDIVEGLGLGADDYITKPFSPRVLIARVNSVLRKTVKILNRTNSNFANAKDKAIEIGELKIIPSCREVFVSKNKIDLTATEFSLLELLAQNAGRVFSRSQIISALRGGQYIITDRAVDVQIRSLRKKLGDDFRKSQFIETLRGVGYRLKEV